MTINVLVTEFDGTNESVMLFSDLTAKQIERFLKIKRKSFGEVYEVPGKDLQFYIYDPVHVTEAQRRNVLNTLAKAN